MSKCDAESDTTTTPAAKIEADTPLFVEASTSQNRG